MAATDRLIITYTGNDERTNIARPPAVPVGELLDVVGPRASSIKHPLQPFDPRNFSGRRGAVELRPRDARGRAGAGRRARASRGRSCSRRCRRATRPARARRPRALRPAPRRARSCASGSGSASATTPTSSATRCRSSSTRWSAGASASGCWTRCCAGRDGRTAIRAEIARGKLPPGQLGRPVVREIWQDVEEIARRARGADRRGRSRLGGRQASTSRGRRLTGTVPGVARRRC